MCRVKNDLGAQIILISSRIRLIINHMKSSNLSYGLVATRKISVAAQLQLGKSQLQPSCNLQNLSCDPVATQDISVRPSRNSEYLSCDPVATKKISVMTQLQLEKS
jgi:hypothetical protein